MKYEIEVDGINKVFDIEKKEKGEPSPLAEEVKAKELRQQQLEELENLID